MSDLLTAGVSTEELRACDTNRVAESILAVMDAMKHRVLQREDVKFMDMIDYEKLEDDTIFTVSLILDGIMLPQHRQEDDV